VATERDIKNWLKTLKIAKKYHSLPKNVILRVLRFFQNLIF